jgi:hypothetical protein
METPNQNQELPSTTNSSSSAGWTADEKRKIASIIYPLIETQKAYGRNLNPELIMSAWEAVLSPYYNAEQICYALIKYAKEVGDDFPSPKNIDQILNPKPPRITEAQYIEAQKWQERNGYPMFSEAKDTIDAYLKQQQEEQEKFKTENEHLLKLAGSSVKKIES